MVEEVYEYDIVYATKSTLLYQQEGERRGAKEGKKHEKQKTPPANEPHKVYRVDLCSM